MGPKDIIIGILIFINIVANSLIIFASGNILPNKDDTQTISNIVAPNSSKTTRFYQELLYNNLNISINQNEPKNSIFFLLMELQRQQGFLIKHIKGYIFCLYLLFFLLLCYFFRS